MTQIVPNVEVRRGKLQQRMCRPSDLTWPPAKAFDRREDDMDG